MTSVTLDSTNRIAPTSVDAIHQVGRLLIFSASKL